MTGKIKKIISIENGDSFVADIEGIENRITQNSSNLETAKQELSNKCNEALSEAKAYTDTEKAKLFNSTNGTFTGNDYYRNISNDYLRFNSGKEYGSGASLLLYGREHSEQGNFVIMTASINEADAIGLEGTSLGSLTWGDKNIVRTVNGEVADKNGNAVVISHTIQNTNNFASTFLHNNNALKIQCVRISGNQGQQYGTVNWLVPFTDTNYHVFVTSEDTDTNLAFQFANVSLIEKTTTSCKVGHKVENTNQFYTSGFISVVGIGY